MTNDKIGFRRSLHSSKARIALFEDEREDARYTEWLNRKVARNLSDSRPAMPHDEAMARLDAAIAAARKGS
jgi:hypothetical protein